MTVPAGPSSGDALRPKANFRDPAELGRGLVIFCLVTTVAPPQSYFSSGRG